MAEDFPARYWEALEGGAVRCKLCPNECLIGPGKTGFCRVRAVRNGNLVSLAYGKVTSVALDPVEKKPLYHFEPGSLLLSVGTFGCNFYCEFCQNYLISQGNPEWEEISPEELVEITLRQKKRYGKVTGIAYTYNEPTIWFEYVLETSRLAKQVGLRNVLVTNGYISPEPLEELLPLVDAMNIDVKAWRPEFYRKLVHGRLEPVLATVERAVRSCHVELTHLVIPGENDDEEDMRQLSSWVAKLNPAVPLHLSRYFPHNRMTAPPTPVSTLEKLYRVARENLHYVYVGNVWRREFSHTLCPQCGAVLLERGPLELEASHLTHEKKCPKCGRPADVVGQIHLGRW